ILSLSMGLAQVAPRPGIRETTPSPPSSRRRRSPLLLPRRSPSPRRGRARQHTARSQGHQVPARQGCRRGGSQEAVRRRFLVGVSRRSEPRQDEDRMEGKGGGTGDWTESQRRFESGGEGEGEGEGVAAGCRTNLVEEKSSM
ncbi:hypothetical protein HKX48_007126, partial [Thoreauomyces humboldtii]